MVALAKGRPIVPGEARGRLLVCNTPLSVWGGIDPTTGDIIDRRHDRFGECVSGVILALPSEKGSSTGSAVLLELIRVGKAPAAIITCHLAPIIALGSIIAGQLYGDTIPIVLISEEDYQALPDGQDVHATADEVFSAAEVSQSLDRQINRTRRLFPRIPIREGDDMILR